MFGEEYQKHIFPHRQKNSKCTTYFKTKPERLKVLWQGEAAGLTAELASEAQERWWHAQCSELAMLPPAMQPQHRARVITSLLQGGPQDAVRDERLHRLFVSQIDVTYTGCPEAEASHTVHGFFLIARNGISPPPGTAPSYHQLSTIN